MEINENPNYYAIITADVRYNRNLKGNEKLMFGEITALSNKHGYCTASNRYFANLFGCHKNTISDYISNLRKERIITIELIYKEKAVIERRIYPSTKSLIPINQMVDTPIHQITEENNTSINNKKEKEEALKKIVNFYENNIGLIADFIYQEINTYLDDDEVEADLIIACLEEAISRNKRNWKYAKAILDNCILNNIKTRKNFEIKQKEFKENGSKKVEIKQDKKYSNDFSEYDTYARGERQNE